MKINLEIVDAAYIYAKEEIDELNTKELVPKMATRRRLTRASKIAVYLASKIAYNNERIVYGSSFGELYATENILETIAKQEAISPTQFQNSVYNIPVSYLSMLSNNKNEIMTISSGDKTSKDILKAGAIKSMDGDEIILMVIESLNINAIEDLNSCVDHLECGVALKVKLTTQQKNLEFDSLNELKLPSSTVEMFNIAKKCSETKNIIEVTL